MTATVSEVLRDVPTELIIGGEHRAASDGATFEVIDPATGDALTTVASGTVEDAIACVDAASAAAREWASTAPRKRSEILQRTYQLMVDRADDLARLITAENGKALPDARGEVLYSAEFFRWYAEEAVRIRGDIQVAPGGANKIIVVRQPVGVAVLVTPWNFPAAMAARKIAPALAAGCTVILKPAGETPLTALAIAAIMEQAGVPAGVVNVLPSKKSAAVVSAMLADPRVRKLSFTGSTEVGRTLLNLANEHIVNCSMELGGNAPFVVFDDADLDAALEGAMIAKMRNGGEACTAANRLYVAESIAEEFTDRLTRAMGAMVVGPGAEPGVTVGPLVNASTRDKVAELVDDAVTSGASVTTGGTSPDGPGFFYPPTVLTNVSPERSDPADRDLRTRGSDRHLLHRAGSDRAGERHRVRLGCVRLYRRPRPRPAGQRGNRGRHGRPEPRAGIRPRRTLWRSQGERPRPRRGGRWTPRLHRK